MWIYTNMPFNLVALNHAMFCTSPYGLVASTKELPIETKPMIQVLLSLYKTQNEETLKPAESHRHP